ncbi:uncharacterized protein LOC119588099 isoform X2 [Penaeus monodon]|uniref:uncharacterized protein LOC119588099 isoform X2 n=1 Tax=Penaeus monodon TaxID=6687 RepID=UPI0018A73154|nr:uncharacterized protein LOC119588099 isoform X2 [Penaeus monodon]
MVKCRSLIWKYFNSEPVDNKENSYKITSRKRLYSRGYMASTSKSSHRPKWRRVCDDWVDRRLEGRQGVTTPVHVLYNTYLSENPKHYMDIAQFGKVLKSRFKNQKCRRGGQGAQIYVYKNVAIKSLDETKGDVSPSGPRLATSSDVTPPLPCSATLSDVTASHPRPATTSNASPPPPCSTSLSDVTLSPSRSATPSDVRDPSPTQPSKRKASAESSIIPKKRKFFFENSLPQGTPPDSPAAESFVSRSEHSASPAAPNVASQQEPSERAAYGSGVCEPTQFLANSQSPKYNLRPASQAASVAPKETSLWDEEQHVVSGRESPVEAQGISCRMAVGRKWVDAQLRDNPGARTFAWEVAAAYARDHPDEPLPDTSIAVLIRNKFPSRRKAFKQGPVTTYYFQDLELVNREGLCEVPAVKEHSGPPSNVEGRASPSDCAPGTEASTLVKTSEDGKPIAVVNPPAQSVFIMNGVPCVALRVTPISVGPSDPQGSTTQQGCLQNIKQKDSISYEVLPKIQKEQLDLRSQSPRAQNDLKNGLGLFHLPSSAKAEEGGTIKTPLLQSEVADSPKYILSNFQEKIEPLTENNSSFDQSSSPKYNDNSDMNVSQYIDSEMNSEVKEKLLNVLPTPLTTDIPISIEKNKAETKDHIHINENVSPLDKISENLSLIETASPKKVADNAEFPIQKSKVWDADMRKFARANNQDTKKVKRNRKLRKSSKHCEGSHSETKQVEMPLAKERDVGQNCMESVTDQETEYRFDEGRMESIKRTILETALNLFSEEGASLPEGERARRLEAALYERNPAVQYKDGVPWPSTQSEDAEEFPCRASQILAEASALAQGDATQLLYHHQYCPGQGCSYNGDLCLSLRAAYTHISIFRHRCHVWHCFSGVLALHASSCSRVDCPVQFCLFAKHELSSRGLLSWPAVEAERQLLRREFDECERSGRHEARLHCHHRQRVQLPLPKPVKRDREMKPEDGAGDAESRVLVMGEELVAARRSPSPVLS